MVTINGERIQKVIDVRLFLNSDNDHGSPHIRIDFWHDDRLEMNPKDVLENFDCQFNEEPGEDINWGSIFLPIETEVHFKT